LPINAKLNRGRPSAPNESRTSMNNSRRYASTASDSARPFVQRIDCSNAAHGIRPLPGFDLAGIPTCSFLRPTIGAASRFDESALRVPCRLRLAEIEDRAAARAGPLVAEAERQHPTDGRQCDLSVRAQRRVRLNQE